MLDKQILVKQKVRDEAISIEILKSLEIIQKIEVRHVHTQYW